MAAFGRFTVLFFNIIVSVISIPPEGKITEKIHCSSSTQVEWMFPYIFSGSPWIMPPRVFFSVEIGHGDAILRQSVILLA